MISQHQPLSIAWVNSPVATPPQRVDCCITFYQKLDSFLTPSSGFANQHDLIIIGVHRPDELSVSEVEELIQQHPLAEILFVNGPWAEGTPRSRQTIPLAWSVPHYRADHRIAVSCQNLLSGRAPIPATATYQQGFQREFTDSISQPKTRAAFPEFVIQVHSRDPAYADFLNDWLDSLGVLTTTDLQQRNPTPQSSPDLLPDLLIVDVDPICADHWKLQVSTNTNAAGIMPWIALTGEPDYRNFLSAELTNPPVALWHKQQSLTVWEASLSSLIDRGMIAAACRQ